jgi:hypothetical protein
MYPQCNNKKRKEKKAGEGKRENNGGDEPNRGTIHILWKCQNETLCIIQ